MLDSQVLDVAIGLVVMFFLLALTSSSIVEAISGVFNIRGKQLDTAIKQLVSDPQHTLDVWNTSVFGALQAGTRTTAGGAERAQKKKTKRTPSYVPARAFADATIEAISALKAGGSWAAALEQQLPSNLKSRLDALTNEVGTDLNGIKAGLESWFDETMERTAGAFKRWSQIVLVIVALVLSIALNASTTRVAATLWNDATVRDVVVNAARNVNQNAPTTSGDLKNIGDTVSSVQSLHLPLGWKDWDSQAGAIGTVAGWLITALLVMLGAPFWYGLLTRLVSLRATGDKPPPATKDPTSASTVLAARSDPPRGAVTLVDALAAIPSIAPPT